jgi:hypothetical protein
MSHQYHDPQINQQNRLMHNSYQEKPHNGPIYITNHPPIQHITYVNYITVQP